MVLRGLTRRCAWCGGRGAFFTSWFRKGDACRTCGMSWNRHLEGFELGAATMGVFITFGTILAWMALGVLLGASVTMLIIVAACLAVALPVLGYPLTYTIWFGVDLKMHAPEQSDLDEAAARRASHR